MVAKVSGQQLMQQIRFEVRLPVQFHKEGRAVIAYTPALDLSSQGASHEAAARSLVQAIRLWFDSCYERGTLEAALKECGFRPVRPGEESQEEEGEEGEFVTVPFPLMAARNDTPAHAR